MTERRISGRLLGAVLFGLAFALPAATPAQAGPVERLFTRYYGFLPDCDNGWMLATIWARFAHKEGRFWPPGDSIHGFDQVREIENQWDHRYIPRRYCEARVRLASGKVSVVRYSFSEGGGFAGMGWGVEFCVVGSDHNNAYAPRCLAGRR